MPTIYRNHKILDSFEGYIDQGAIDFARRIIDNLYIQPKICLYDGEVIIAFTFHFDNGNSLYAFFNHDGSYTCQMYSRYHDRDSEFVLVKTDAEFIKVFLDISRK